MLKIGVTGATGVGKTTFVEYLAGKGFEKISLSDLIREEAKRRGIELTRRNLQDLGREVRQADGLGEWARRAIRKMDPGKNYVIDSIRNPGEIKALAQAGDFHLVKLDAPVQTRFARLAARGSRHEAEPRTLEDFKKSEARELVSEDLASQQLNGCAAMADSTIFNDSDKESFFKKIDDFLLSAAGKSI